MRFMNRWDIDRTVGQYEDHPVLGPATQTLLNLQEWTDDHSDGWAYWPKPCRAAKRLMELIEGDGIPRPLSDDREDATVEQYKAALRPVKAFRTRQNADFVIVEIG